MSYFAVDDDFALHPKVIDCDSNAPIGLWCRAGSWCQKHLTDGYVPDRIVALLGSAAEAAELVRAKLWLRQAAGYQFHEWSQRQGRREDILARRRTDAARKAQRGLRPESERNSERSPAGVPSGVRAESLRPTPTPTPTEEERDLYLPPPLPALTGSARAHNTNGGGEDEYEPNEREDKSRAQAAFEWLHALLFDVVQQPAPRLAGRWQSAYRYISAQPAAEWLAVEACLRSELSSGRLRGRQCTPGHVADYWQSYAASEPPGGGNGRSRSGPSVVGTQAEHDAEQQLEEPLP